MVHSFNPHMHGKSRTCELLCGKRTDVGALCIQVKPACAVLVCRGLRHTGGRCGGTAGFRLGGIALSRVDHGLSVQ